MVSNVFTHGVAHSCAFLRNNEAKHNVAHTLNRGRCKGLRIDIISHDK